MVVIELPMGDSEAPATAKQFVEGMKKELNPSPKCTKLGFIFVWRRAQAVLNMRCDYKGCYRNGLRAIDGITRQVSRIKGVQQYQKGSLIKALHMATAQLYSTKEGARMNAEKVVILVLSNPPVKGVAKIEDEVKDYHDMRIRFIAVGVGAGRKEKLADIVVDNALKIEFESMQDLAAAGVKTIAIKIPFKTGKWSTTN